MKIFYNFASRSRSNKMFAAIDNIIRLAKHDYYFIGLTLDIDDPSCNTPEVKERLNSYGDKVNVIWGYSKSKIDAINKNVNMYNFDILVNMSDDMHWHKEGFDLDIIADFKEHFPDLNGALHYPDGYANERLCTLSIMGKPLYDYFGYVYHPAYSSLFCDDEFCAVTKQLGKIKYINKSLFKHEHPLHNGQRHLMDKQYQYTESFYAQDKEVFERRKAINFGL